MRDAVRDASFGIATMENTLRNFLGMGEALAEMLHALQPEGT